MRETEANMWEDFDDESILCITTNGDVMKDGAAIMGAGTAGQAAQKYPLLPYVYGSLLMSQGHDCYYFPIWKLLMFPVKDRVIEKAKIPIIVQSCLRATALADVHGWSEVVLPQPGCGAGGLSWEDVKPVIEPLLDDRFIVVSYNPYKYTNVQDARAATV